MTRKSDLICETSWRGLCQEEDGAYVIEFAFAFPILMLLIMACFDFGYQLYNQSVLDGELYKAARDSSMEDNIGANATVLDNRIKEMMWIMAADADIDFERKSFHDFVGIDKMEPFTDTNKNGSCDNGEPFEDRNNSGARDVDSGQSGQGGAKDVVIYKATMTYPRLVPMFFDGGSEEIKLESQTVLENQPFAQQTATIVRNCN